MPDIADLIAQYIGPQDQLGVADATLTKKTAGTRTALSGGTNPTPKPYKGRGTVENTNQFSNGTLLAEGHVLISLLGGTFPAAGVPAVDDTIFIASKRYPSGATYKVTRVIDDTVGAVYECEARRT